VGRSHRIVLGKHSGSRAVQLVMDRLGHELNEAQAQKLLIRVRNFVEEAKRPPADTELLAMFREEHHGHV